jgi:hypothetical protein
MQKMFVMHYYINKQILDSYWFAMVLGIGWNFPEILSDMCTHHFEA